ncbi:MAG: zinc-finger domain-containing protein [Casimicrobiaceae bacterium]
MSASSLTETTVTITAKDLPLFCPRPNAPLWSQHPRVYLEVEEDGAIRCPYCSTCYVLAGGLVKGGH